MKTYEGSGMELEDLRRRGLNERDIDIIKLMATFGGKTFNPVLEKTIWLGYKSAAQQVSNRMSRLLKQHKIIRRQETGLQKPRYLYKFTELGKRVCEDIGFRPGNFSFSTVTIWHGIYEQIAFYWLEKIGKKPHRTTVREWVTEGGKKHAPDLVYKNPKGDYVYVEVELNKKRPDSYISIFEKMQQDGAASALYIFENEKKMQQIGRVIPIWEKVYYVTIEQLIKAAQNGKIGAVKQSDFLAGD